MQHLHDVMQFELDAHGALVVARGSAVDRLRSLNSSENDAHGSVELPEARILRLQEGDVLLFQAPKRLTDEDAAVLVERIEATFPGHRALVLEGGIELTVARIGSC